MSIDAGTYRYISDLLLWRSYDHQSGPYDCSAAHTSDSAVPSSNGKSSLMRPRAYALPSLACSRIYTVCVKVLKLGHPPVCSHIKSVQLSEFVLGSGTVPSCPWVVSLSTLWHVRRCQTSWKDHESTQFVLKFSSWVILCSHVKSVQLNELVLESVRYRSIHGAIRTHRYPSSGTYVGS